MSMDDYKANSQEELNPQLVTATLYAKLNDYEEALKRIHECCPQTTMGYVGKNPNYYQVPVDVVDAVLSKWSRKKEGE